jgi:hypothetical protein
MSRSTTRTALALSGALAALGLSLSAAAQEIGGLPVPFSNNYAETETARTAAMGGAMRALGSGTAGMFLNPASIALTRVYHVEGILQTTPEVGRLMAGGVVVDSIMNRYGLAGGVAVLGGFLDPDGTDWSTLDLRFALAYPISDKLYIGVAPRYASLTQGRELTPPQDGMEDLSELHLHAFTLDAGITVKATDAFALSIVGQNAVSTHRGVLPTMIGGGVAYGTSDFTFEVDGLADLNSYSSVKARIMAGGEVLIADHFPIRLGYRFDHGAKLHALSAGLGYVGKEFAIEASLRRTLSDPGATTVVVGLADHLESTSFIRDATEGFAQPEQ